jgi:hypothetical protein
MALSLPKGLGSKRQAYLLAVLAVLLILFVVRWRPGGQESSSAAAAAAALRGPRAGNASPDAADAPAPVARERGSAKVTSPDEVPLLKPEDFGPAPVKGSTDTGRDLFGLHDPTPVPPPTPTPHGPLAGEAGFVGPLPPPPPTPTPKPPEITFKFLGTFGPKEHPIAVLREGDSIYNARAGDILFGKFVLRKVGYESIDVGFVGFADTETKRLGITP